MYFFSSSTRAHNHQEEPNTDAAIHQQIIFLDEANTKSGSSTSTPSSSQFLKELDALVHPQPAHAILKEFALILKGAIQFVKGKHKHIAEIFRMMQNNVKQ